MGEGAVTIAADAVLYCNRRFAEIIKRPLNLIMGAAFPTFIAARDQPLFKQLLAARGGDRKEIDLRPGMERRSRPTSRQVWSALMIARWSPSS